MQADAPSFSGCSLVPRGMEEIWHLALEHYRATRPGLFLALLLPQLEHALRVLYVQANDVEDERYAGGFEAEKSQG